jgi:hypothetical protein
MFIFLFLFFIFLSSLCEIKSTTHFLECIWLALLVNEYTNKRKREREEERRKKIKKKEKKERR